MNDLPPHDRRSCSVDVAVFADCVLGARQPPEQVGELFELVPIEALLEERPHLGEV